VPLPNYDTDWLTGMAAQMQNQQRWSQEPGIREWLIENRLDAFSALTQANEQMTPEQMQILMRIKEAMPQVIANMPKLIKEAMMLKRPAST